MKNYAKWAVVFNVVVTTLNLWNLYGNPAYNNQEPGLAAATFLTGIAGVVGVVLWVKEA
jgi:hypothetical protein